MVEIAASIHACCHLESCWIRLVFNNQSLLMLTCSRSQWCTLHLLLSWKHSHMSLLLWLDSRMCSSMWKAIDPSDHAWLHLFIALLLLAQDKLFLSIKKTLSGFRLTGHHELWGEMPSTLMMALFWSHHLTLYAWGALLFVTFNTRYCWCFWWALPALIWATYRLKWIPTSACGWLFWVVKGLVLVENFIFGD